MEVGGEDLGVLSGMPRSLSVSTEGSRCLSSSNPGKSDEKRELRGGEGDKAPEPPSGSSHPLAGETGTAFPALYISLAQLVKLFQVVGERGT